jgi:hypothetical protein
MCVAAAGDLWLLNTDDQSSLLDAVLESFRIQDATVSMGAVAAGLRLVEHAAMSSRVGWISHGHHCITYAFYSRIRCVIS